MQNILLFSIFANDSATPMRIRSAIALGLIGLSLVVLQANAQALPKAAPAGKPVASAGAKAANDASAPLQSTLSAFIVSKDKDGKEVFTPATNTRPGQIMEYRALYRNVSKNTLERLAMTLPIPAGTVYVDKSANPARGALAAIVNSTAYAPVPLVRIVKDENGKDKKVAVPLEEYRNLRWELTRLEAGKSFEVKARVRVAENTAPAKE